MATISGLDVARIVNVQVNMSPQATRGRDFGTLCLLGDSPVIPIEERLRTYNNIKDVLVDFPNTSPEALAASVWFAQRPQPVTLAIARMAITNTYTTLTGDANQAVTDFQEWVGITDGAFDIQLRAPGQDVPTDIQLGGFDFSAVTSISDVLNVMTPALATEGFAISIDNTIYGGFVLTYQNNPGAYRISVVTPLAGTDIGSTGFLNLQTAHLVEGALAESVQQAVSKLQDYQWYGLHLCLSQAISTQDHQSIANIIEASSPSRMYGITVNDPATLSYLDTTSTAYTLSKANLMKTFCQYTSATSGAGLYAAVSYMARIFTTDFTANNTVITMKFKQEPTITAELLTSSQADRLKEINCNVYVQYNNDTVIVQEGTMCNGYFTDEVYGLDWLQNAVQVAYYNVLYGAKKIPQTQVGLQMLATAVTGAVQRGVVNGLVGAGVWTAESTSYLETGAYLSSGYFVFTPAMADQPSSERDARIAPTIEVAVKLAGAIHFGNVIINVNR